MAIAGGDSISNRNLFVDWEKYEASPSIDFSLARELVKDAYAKADLEYRASGDVHAAGLADGMVFAYAVLESLRKEVS